MSTASTFWKTEWHVARTSHDRHRHNPSPIAPGFNAPHMCTALRFSPRALAAAMARTATLGSAPPDMLEAWKQKALADVEWLIEEGSEFSLSRHFHHLADADRSAFAASVGAGVTDLLMNALGYTWRDNAACISGSLDPKADFIYADGRATGHGVVLAEARGSFAMDASASGTRSKGKRKYLRQVKPHLARTTPHGSTVHGYSIAFGSRPSASGAFLHVSETKIAGPPGGRSGPTGSAPPGSSESTPTTLALASHRSNFALMGARSVVNWIDWLLGRDVDDEDRLPEIFLEVPYAGRRFLLSADFSFPYEDLLETGYNLLRFVEMRDSLYQRWPFLDGRKREWGLFAMEVASAERFLDSLGSIIREGGDVLQQSLELPRAETAGFTSVQDDTREGRRDAEHDYAVYGDGLALLGSPRPREMDGFWIWSPKNGMVREDAGVLRE